MSPVESLDREALLWVVEHRVGWLDPVFIALTVVGYVGLIWVALAPLLALWTRRGLLGATAVTAASVWLADLVTTGLKAVVDRARPFEALPEADPLLGPTVGSSMPSGHASTSFAGAVILSLLVRRAVPALFALAVLIAFSRVYLGVHYPLDVLVGAAIGTAVALAVVAVLRSRRRLSETPPRSEGEPPPG